jgi:GntR family transcriptional regulator
VLIRIEASSGVPITRQIVDQIRTRCASGALKAGDRLPSVRELARQITVNQNTVLRAYERLTAEGVLELRHGDGTFVADFAAARQLKRERTALGEEALRLVRKATVVGMRPEQIHAMVDDAMDAARVPKQEAK